MHSSSVLGMGILHKRAGGVGCVRGALTSRYRKRREYRGNMVHSPMP